MTRAALLLVSLAGPAAAADRPNVLFVVFDDLRPQLGCYGDRAAKTPHLDRFAGSALRFDRAYCQSAVCSPSRNSFLSGLRPATTGLYGFGTTLREKVPDAVTLPQHFKNSGYHTAAIGKVFHVYAETGLMSEDDPASWGEPLYLPGRPVWGPEQERVRAGLVAAARAAGNEFKHSHDWPRPDAWDAPAVADDELQDGEVAAVAVGRLKALKATGRPFFLAVGFLKPHLPFVAPKRYWDLYREADLTLPADQRRPADAPPFAGPPPGPDRLSANVPKDGRVDDAFKRRFLHGYLASVSYADAQFGRLLDALDALGLRENTVVVAFGDHGYQMGEHGGWGTKHSNYETSTRVPLLVAAPGAAAGKGTNALVELVDLYPTLADLAGLPPARAEGTSFRPLLADPGRPWKAAAFSEHRAGRQRAAGPVLGTAMRTDRYRYVEWADRTGTVVARELYDHRADPGEDANVAGRPENRATVERLSRQLRAGWAAARPPAGR